MEQTNGIKTWQWIVTVVVIILLIVLGYKMFSGSSSAVVSKTENVDTATSTATKVENANLNRIMVSDQAPGNKVYISSVQLSAGGFVVVQKDNKGTPGDIMGDKYFERGIYPGQVSLTSPTAENGTYYAVIYSDDGDKKFDSKKDLPLKDSAGNVILKVFKVTSSPTDLKG